MRTLLVACSIVLSSLVPASHAADSGDSAERGLQQCKRGNYHLALQALHDAYDRQEQGASRARTANGLGLTYMRMGMPAQAEPYLREAYAATVDATDRARHGIDLANLLASRGEKKEAVALYEEALRLLPADVTVALSVGLNIARMESGEARLGRLARLESILAQVADPRERARFAINLGVQAKESGPGGLRLAYQMLDMARTLALEARDARLGAEALDHLSQLYEDGKRADDALRLTAQGILLAQSADARDLLLRLEWRQARLMRQSGRQDAAISAYRRAVGHIEAIRQDIPVEYMDGRSSFRETLEPVYLGLADLLLQQSALANGEEKAARLREARDTVELIKQTELEDFLGDRCSVDTVRQAAGRGTLPPRTAVLYPVILPDRLELLVETPSGLQHRTVPVTADALRADVLGYAAALRAVQPYQRTARRLYDALLKPFEDIVASERVETMVIVPDGVLRLLPFSALHDGQQFAIQKYAIAMVPGLTMTSTQRRENAGRHPRALLAGVSEPGQVVEKLPDFMTEQLLAAGDAASMDARAPASRTIITRALQQRDMKPAPKKAASGLPEAEKAERSRKLQQILALSGVQEEIDALGRLAPGQTLLNQTFSAEAFGEQIRRGNFGIVHIASHGVFGGTADTTFIMAHDDLITIDRLQEFLRTASGRDQGIELLTLSACETAEGDDRAPLGLTGAALKARARSVLGSLWPVADEAAKTMMTQFYANLAQPGSGKVQALQTAQLQVMGERNFAHPFFWAPFVLVGGWQ